MGTPACRAATEWAQRSPSFRDTDTSVKTRGLSTGIVDAASFDMSDKFLGLAKLGVGYESKGGSFGLSYGLSKGSLRDLSHELEVKGTLYF